METKIQEQVDKFRTKFGKDPLVIVVGLDCYGELCHGYEIDARTRLVDGKLHFMGIPILISEGIDDIHAVGDVIEVVR